MQVFEGNFAAGEMKIGIVVARFNEFITSKLLSGALDALKRHQINEDSIHAVSYTHLFFFYQR